MLVTAALYAVTCALTALTALMTAAGIRAIMPSRPPDAICPPTVNSKGSGASKRPLAMRALSISFHPMPKVISRSTSL